MRKVFSIILLVLWMTLIFSFSNANGTSSGHLSTLIIKKVVTTFTNIEEDSETMDKIVDQASFYVRKCAHAIEYFILALLVINVLVTFKIKKRFVLIAVLFCFLYALSDEIHQLFIAGRSGQMLDVLLDTSASFLCVILCKLTILRGWINEKE